MFLFKQNKLIQNMDLAKFVNFTIFTVFMFKNLMINKKVKAYSAVQWSSKIYSAQPEIRIPNGIYFIGQQRRKSSGERV